MFNFYIYMAVIVSGGSVLALELLGTRILAPFYGASLYLWSALISITLAALSVGYAIGGRWADRGPKLSRFSTMLGLAGVWIALVPIMRTPVLAISETAGLRTAVLVTAFALFFPPLTLLGMTSPYAIRLKASSLDVVGRTSGNLFSISTIASVVAAVATGFFLIPNVGVTRLLLLIGLALVGTSVFGLILARGRKLMALSALFIVTYALGFQFAPGLSADPEKGLIAIAQSAYGEIRVVELDDARYMVLDGGIHTIIDPMTWDSRFPYVNVLDLARGFSGTPGEMLLVGLGGGSVAKSFKRAGWNVDAVEIDPAIPPIAYQYFGLRKEEAAVYPMDARQYLITHDKKYDAVVMDAFGSSSIPFHLVTTEAFRLIRSRMTEDGVLAMNVEAVGWDDIIVRSLAVTIGEEFDHVLVLPIAEPPDQIGNLILLASNRPLELPEEPPRPEDRFSADYDRFHAWENRFEVARHDVPILTDDLNPIDVWAERVNFVARKDLHAFFGDSGLSW